jgi:hypothetical protein
MTHNYMETKHNVRNAASKKENLKKVASVLLIILSIFIVARLAATFQTSYQLVSPVIPKSAIWDINKQYIFVALVSAIANLIGLVLYFFDKYLIVIILVGLTLIVSNYIYI